MGEEPPGEAQEEGEVGGIVGLEVCAGVGKGAVVEGAGDPSVAGGAGFERRAVAGAWCGVGMSVGMSAFSKLRQGRCKDQPGVKLRRPWAWLQAIAAEYAASVARAGLRKTALPM